MFETESFAAQEIFSLTELAPLLLCFTTGTLTLLKVTAASSV